MHVFVEKSFTDVVPLSIISLKLKSILTFEKVINVGVGFLYSFLGIGFSVGEASEIMRPFSLIVAKLI